MSTFAYTAIARDGKRTNGTLTADSRAAAISQVTRLGLHPLKIDEQKNGKAAKVVKEVKPLKVAKPVPAPMAPPPPKLKKPIGPVPVIPLESAPVPVPTGRVSQ